jgi:hypothetical protein
MATIKLNRQQRDAIYGEVVLDLSGTGDIRVNLDSGDYAAAREHRRRYEEDMRRASAVLAGDGLGVGGGQALGRARTTARRRGHPEVLGTELGHEVLPERGPAIGQ